MQVRYHNKLEHLVSLQKYMLRHSSLGRKMMTHRFIMVEVLIVLIFAMLVMRHDPFKVVLGFIIASCLAWIFREQSALLQFKREFKREMSKDDSGDFHAERILQVSPDGLTMDAVGGRQHLEWSRIEGVGQDSRHIYILVKGVLHYVVPKTAFADADHAQAFFETLRAHLHGSLHPHPDGPKAG